MQEEAKDLVNENWLNSKKSIVLKIFNKDENENENEYKSGDITIKLLKEKEGKTKITNLEEVEEKLKTNTQTWALFEITYKKKEGEEKKTKYLYCSDIESGKNNGIFEFCKQHISISVMDCDTSNVTNMYSMFWNCKTLTKIIFGDKFNTGKVKNMHGMFGSCVSLKELDISKFNTDNVTNMRSMFYNCSSLAKLDLSKFNTDNVATMSGMFGSCVSLKELDISKFNTDNVTSMCVMFYNCSSLTKLDLSKFDTKNVTNMSGMFSECSSLQTVTFNKNLNEGIEQLLKELGFTEKCKEEGNIITLGKKQ